MLPRWLTTLKVLVRLGVAAARFCAAGLRLRTRGRAATTNGRIWFWTMGALGLARAVTAALAAGRALAAGSRFFAVGPSRLANVVTLLSGSVVWARVPGRSRTAALMLASWDAKARNTVEEASTRRTIWPWLWLSEVLRRWSELTSWRRSVPRTATALLRRARSRWVGSKRSNTWASSE